MTASTRPTRRVATAFALAAGAALTLSACGAGQIAQTANQVAAVNGNGADSANISLRNVHVLFPSSDEFRLGQGGRAELAFTAVNTSDTNPDTLVSISTDAASSVTLDKSADLTIEPQTSIAAYSADAELPGQSAVQGPPVTAVLENLTDAVRPGLTVPVTFTFSKAGPITVPVPVDAAGTPRAENAQSGPHEEGE